MKSIPRAAMPVVRVLRRDVKRPGMPRGGMSWRRARWAPGVWTCPMGLHPEAKSAMPFFAGDFPAPERAIDAFAWWSDSVQPRDIPAAMDAIWGPK